MVTILVFKFDSDGRPPFNMLNSTDRWSNLLVSALNLQAPLSIVPSVTCQEAIDIMKKEGFDQLPVVDKEGYRKKFKLKY